MSVFTAHEEGPSTRVVCTGHYWSETSTHLVVLNSKHHNDIAITCLLHSKLPDMLTGSEEFRLHDTATVHIKYREQCRRKLCQHNWVKKKSLTRHVMVHSGVSLVGMWRSSSSTSNSTTFELRTFWPDSKFDECFKRFVVECEFEEKSLFYDWFHMHRQPESADKPVFPQIQPITQTTVTYEWAT